MMRKSGYEKRAQFSRPHVLHSYYFFLNNFELLGGRSQYKLIFLLPQNSVKKIDKIKNKKMKRNKEY